MNIKVNEFIVGNKFVLTNGSSDPTWPHGLDELVGKTLTVQEKVSGGYFAENCDYVIKPEWMKETIEDDLTLYQTTEFIKVANQVLSRLGVFDFDVSNFGPSILISDELFKKTFTEYETQKGSNGIVILKAKINGVEARCVTHEH